MLSTLLTVALTTPLPLACFPAPLTDGTQPPPGMVFLKSERVMIGLDDDTAKDIILGEDGQRTSIWGETPAHRVKIDDFYIMSTEVTNEQFLEYISVSGSQPPELWGKDAIDTARRTFLEKNGKERAQARAEGKEMPAKAVFVSDEWWRLNWEDAEWEVPKNVAALPVTKISFDQARAYARWAGVRLLTEEEYQRAVRGKTENLYPWGMSWDADKVISIETKGDRLWPVGSRVAGASPEGVYDLAGNVWEWTSSPYVAYPKYKPHSLKMKTGSRTQIVDLLVEWDPALRITVGGSFKNEKLAARATTRRKLEAFQTTDALGFRCAASPTICYDIASIVEREDVARSIRSDHEFDLSLTVAMDRWKWRKGEAGKRLDNYAVITDYDYLLFSPIAEISSSSLTTLGKRTLADGPLLLGYLSTTLPISTPALEPGTYIIGWRAEGKSRPAKTDEDAEEGQQPAKTLEEQIEFDPEIQNLIIMDSHGTPLMALPCKGLDLQKLHAGSIAVTEVPADERTETAAHEMISITAAVPAGRRGFFFDINLQCEPGIATGDWRKN